MNAPSSPRPIVATGVGYPFLDKQSREIADPQAFHEGLAVVQGGHYLLTGSGFFHGGIHVTRASANAFSLDQGIRCLADGEVIAYRVNQQYHDGAEGTPGDGPAMHPYSTGFVLVRHLLQTPAPPQQLKPAPMDHPMADARNLGTDLYRDPEGRHPLAWLAHGTPVTVDLQQTGSRHSLVRVVDTGGSGLPREGWIGRARLALDPAAGTGLGSMFGISPPVRTYVHGGDKPDPDKMAEYRRNQEAQRQTPAPPAPTLTLYSLYMHVAAYADYAANSEWHRPA